MYHGKQAGFTMVELLVVIAILGFLSVAMAMTFGVVTKVGSIAIGQNEAFSQVHMAGSWVSRDVGNAKGSVNYSTKLCTMLVRVRDDVTASFETDNVTYLIDDNGNLTRTRQRVGSTDPEEIITVARYIDRDGTSMTCENITMNVYFVLTVKASYNESSFERVYKMKQALP